MPLFNSKKEFLEALHRLAKKLSFINEYPKLKYTNFTITDLEKHELIAGKELDWSIYAPELYEYIYFAQRKVEHYPNSVEYRAIYEKLLQVKECTDPEKLSYIFEDLFQECGTHRNDLLLNMLNQMRASERRRKRESKERKRMIFAGMYVAREIDLKTAMDILEIKDKRTFFKYVEKFIEENRG